MNKVNVKAVFKENGHNITAGKLILEEDLCTWFGIQQPELGGLDFNQARKEVVNFQYRKLNAYAGLNKLLRPMGMVISQKQNNYVVKGTRDTVTPVIDSYKRRAATLTNNASILKMGLRG